MCKICSHSGVAYDSCLLEYDTVSLGEYFLVFQRTVVPSRNHKPFTKHYYIACQNSRIYSNTLVRTANLSHCSCRGQIYWILPFGEL